MEKTQNKFKTFLRKNLSYVVVALCVLAIGLATIFVALKKEMDSQDVLSSPETEIIPDEPVISEPDNPTDVPVVNPSEPEEIVFIMPVASYTDVKYFSEMPTFNATLERYAVHTGTDFYASEGADVVAVYDGEVVSVENSLLTGYSVTVEHKDGLRTVYNSLADGDSVSVGQMVKKGDKLGTVSTTNRQEYSEGAHLHFEVLENGVSIDPAKYLMFDEK